MANNVMLFTTSVSWHKKERVLISNNGNAYTLGFYVFYSFLDLLRSIAILWHCRNCHFKEIIRFYAAFAFGPNTPPSFAHHVEGHSFTDRIYGYRKYDTLEEYEKAIIKLRTETDALISQGLSAAVYTQVSDVEEEVNGIMTYDRKVCKLS